MRTLSRRRFIGTSAATAAAISWNNPLFAAAEDEGEGPWDLIAVRNGEAVDMFEVGIAALGGMQAFVKRGQRVVVKPNIAWDHASAKNLPCVHLLMRETVSPPRV